MEIFDSLIKEVSELIEPYSKTEYSYEKGYYEAMSSPFEKGVGELLSKEMKERGKELCQ